MSKARIHGDGYILGYGVLRNPRSVRIDGSYAFVGLVSGVKTDTSWGDEWLNIMPCDEDDGWLEEQGPGILVFIPDD